jgi:hypothetical protein
VLGVDANQQLLVLPDRELPQLESAWLQPLQAALQRGDIERLDVYIDHWHIHFRGGRWAQLRRALAHRSNVSAEQLV